MATVSMTEARRQIDQLVDRAAAGETITISKWGKPLVRLMPLDSKPEHPPEMASKKV